MQPLKAKIIDALKTNERNLDARLLGLGLTRVCSRCSGSGHHSYNQIHGTMCYGCNGRGKQPAKISRETLARAEQIAASGELEAYINNLRTERELKKQIKPIITEIETEWGGGAIHSNYKTRPLSTAEFIKSPTFFRAKLINRLWSNANKYTEKPAGWSVERFIADLKASLTAIKLLNALEKE